MVEKRFESRLAVPVETLWAFHNSVEALKLLTPPNRKVEILSQSVEVEEGALHEIRVRQFGIPIIWHARISKVNPHTEFTDTAEKSPFSFWQHHHEFLADGEGSILRDTLRYQLPFGFFGQIANALFVSKDIDRLFAFRHKATKQALTPQSE